MGEKPVWQGPWFLWSPHGIRVSFNCQRIGEIGWWVKDFEIILVIRFF